MKKELKYALYSVIIVFFIDLFFSFLVLHFAAFVSDGGPSTIFDGSFYHSYIWHNFFQDIFFNVVILSPIYLVVYFVTKGRRLRKETTSK